MKITPERVAKLADALGSGRLNIATQDGAWAMKADEEVWAILRWAAKVMQAGPNRYLVQLDCGENVYTPDEKDFAHEVAAETKSPILEVIIKPEPPEV